MAVLRMEELREIAAAGIGTGYLRLGTPFENPIRNILVQNFTDQELRYSDDGLTDKFVLPAGGQFIYDITANKLDEGNLFIATGVQIYVRYDGAVPTTGNSYLSAFYGYNGHNSGGFL